MYFKRRHSNGLTDADSRIVESEEREERFAQKCFEERFPLENAIHTLT